MNIRKLDPRRPIRLPDKLEWVFADEPTLLEWSLRARYYNTFVANCMLSFMLVALSGMTYLMYKADHATIEPYRSLWCAGFFLIMLLALLSMTHQTMKFAYRITPSGIEYCRWKDFPKWVSTGFNWFAGIMTFLCLSMAAADPSFLIGALLIPLFSYFSVLNSKAYRELQTEYHHNEFHWQDITQVAIATNREVVDIRYQYTPEGQDYTSNWNFNIFCHRKQKEYVASVLRPYLTSGTPVIHAKVNVPLSTD